MPRSDSRRITCIHRLFPVLGSNCSPSRFAMICSGTAIISTFDFVPERRQNMDSAACITTALYQHGTTLASMRVLPINAAKPCQAQTTIHYRLIMCCDRSGLHTFWTTGLIRPTRFHDPRSTSTPLGTSIAADFSESCSGVELSQIPRLRLPLSLENTP